jgi:hypothetical protein
MNTDFDNVIPAEAGIQVLSTAEGAKGRGGNAIADVQPTTAL